ncbi:TasA family protein [Proteinivorax tanatarense]|uniref:TasA family protein n=1 Tax=Proteinivorax tanatarense TaxID=1260629 RepID=A0AAU7VJ93_9FIRM
MSYTISATNQNNQVGAGNVSLIVTEENIFDVLDMVPGQEETGQITVTNDGEVNVNYFIFADWKPANEETSTVQAQILADRLQVRIEDDEQNELYDGSLSGLSEVEGTEALGLEDPDDSDELTFTITLPEDVGNVVQNINITVDLVFVGEAVEEEND